MLHLNFLFLCYVLAEYFVYYNKKQLKTNPMNTKKKLLLALITGLIILAIACLTRSIIMLGISELIAFPSMMLLFIKSLHSKK